MAGVACWSREGHTSHRVTGRALGIPSNASVTCCFTWPVRRSPNLLCMLCSSVKQAVLCAGGYLAKMLCSFSVKVCIFKNRSIKVILWRRRRRRKNKKRGELLLPWLKSTCFCTAFPVYFSCETMHFYTKSHAGHSRRNVSNCRRTPSQNDDIALCLAVLEVLVTLPNWKYVSSPLVCLKE